MKYPEKILLKVSEGTMSRIDAVAPNRSEFIREAVEAALGGYEMDVGAMRKNSVPAVDDGSAPESSFGRPKLVKEPDPAVEAKPSAPARRVSSDVSPRAQDKVDLMAVLRGGRLSSRQAEQAMGWPGLRYANAEKALLASGQVVVDGGVLVATCI